VNGYAASTRARIKTTAGCLLGRYLVQPYTKNECGNNGPATNAGVEYIAQARAITHLNERITGMPTSGTIHPDIQWEVTVGQARVDILYYNHTLPAAAQPYVQVVEAKLESNYDADAWNAQVAKQITALRTRAGSRPGSAGCRIDTGGVQDLPYRGGRDRVPQPSQLALDSPVPPGRVLPRHPHDQCLDRPAGAGPSRAAPVREGPLTRHEMTMPAQDRRRSEREYFRPPAAVDQSRQRRQPEPVGVIPSRPVIELTA
jgi:hypothetical protein